MFSPSAISTTPGTPARYVEPLVQSERVATPKLYFARSSGFVVDPPRRLVQTFTALWSDEVKQEGPSRVTWEIEPVGDSCRLTVTHDQLKPGANGELYGGWPMILSGP